MHKNFRSSGGGTLHTYSVRLFFTSVNKSKSSLPPKVRSTLSVCLRLCVPLCPLTRSTTVRCGQQAKDASNCNVVVFRPSCPATGLHLLVSLCLTYTKLIDKKIRFLNAIISHCAFRSVVKNANTLLCAVSGWFPKINPTKKGSPTDDLMHTAQSFPTKNHQQFSASSSSSFQRSFHRLALFFPKATTKTTPTV